MATNLIKASKFIEFKMSLKTFFHIYLSEFISTELWNNKWWVLWTGETATLNGSYRLLGNEKRYAI